MIWSLWESVHSLQADISLFYFIFLFYCFLGLHQWHMEVPRLGVGSELQLPAYTTATAMQDLSCIFDLHHSSQQHQILNPMSKARGRTCNLMVLVRFVSAVPWQELNISLFYMRLEHQWIMVPWGDAGNNPLQILKDGHTHALMDLFLWWTLTNTTSNSK